LRNAVPNVTLRLATPNEAEVLSELALRSKASWGYDDAFMERLRPSFTLTEAMVRDSRCIVAERDGTIVGFYRLTREGTDGSLSDLFIAPEFLRCGIGKLLLDDAMLFASGSGLMTVSFESDPYALGFYLQLGGEQVAERVSPDSGRLLPWVRFEVAKYVDDL
jgi:GNAT superfamily N-acetyltransferase